MKTKKFSVMDLIAVVANERGFATIQNDQGFDGFDRLLTYMDVNRKTASVELIRQFPLLKEARDIIVTIRQWLREKDSWSDDELIDAIWVYSREDLKPILRSFGDRVHVNRPYYQISESLLVKVSADLVLLGQHAKNN